MGPQAGQSNQYSLKSHIACMSVNPSNLRRKAEEKAGRFDSRL
jgi:hypothetical protein